LIGKHGNQEGALSFNNTSVPVTWSKQVHAYPCTHLHCAQCILKTLENEIK